MGILSKKKATPAKEAPRDSAGAALFYVNPVPLELKRHAKAGVAPTDNYSFAGATNSILLNVIEFAEAAKFYPIVFTQGETPLPSAIVGLESRNCFVDARGKWREGAYIPAYARRYPFAFMEAGKQLLLCVDEAAPQFRKNGGKGAAALYDGDKPSALTRNALEFCTAYHNHHVATRQFCEYLRDAGLLVPSSSKAKLPDGREINLGGFQVIDETKLNALPDSAVLELHRKGWLPLAHFALMSASNWKKLADMAG